MSDTALEAVLRRDRVIVLAWLADDMAMGGMDMTPVSQVMTRDVKTCSENDTVDGLMARMTTGKFRHMPVVEHSRRIAKDFALSGRSYRLGVLAVRHVLASSPIGE
jgi:CBS domain-containing protein